MTESKARIVVVVVKSSNRVFFFRARANVLTSNVHGSSNDAFNKNRAGLSRKKTLSTTTTTKLRAKHSHKLYLKRGGVASLVLSLARASSFSSRKHISRNDDDETKERRALLLQNVVKAARCFRRLFRRLFRRRLLRLRRLFRRRSSQKATRRRIKTASGARDGEDAICC